MVSRRQPHDVLVEGDCLVLEQRHEVVRHASLVEAARHGGERQQPLDLGRECKQLAGAVVIVERLHPKVVPGAEDDLPAGVPDREREVAEQALGAMLAPALVRAEDQFCVRDGAGSTEQGAEFLPVI